MSAVEIRNITPADEWFVATCSHTNEPGEREASGQRRLAYLRNLKNQGLTIKVARIEGKTAGFIYLLPIEQSPWSPTGRYLMVFPCLWVLPDYWKRGAGSALLSAAETEARAQGKKGIVTQGYYWDFWFMAAAFFERRGYTVAERKGDAAVLWKSFAADAEPPAFFKPAYQFTPVPGKVVIDLFHNSFCLTCDVEAPRVREAAAEFGGAVILNDYCSDDAAIRARYQIPRAIMINGKEIGWGCEAPKEGIREAINEALKEVRNT